MDERVECGQVERVTAAHVLDAEPTARNDRRVVIQVEERDLIVLLSECEHNLFLCLCNRIERFVKCAFSDRISSEIGFKCNSRIMSLSIERNPTYQRGGRGFKSETPNVLIGTFFSLEI